ncbi:hypothetical protein HCN44_000381 [Aphidius gifuensis]|uniref:Protein SAAL1 n=1 Tax=Aphidius gifuensis TaxID=684658 RepID=A0A834XQW7_APHGI|nr:protein saal1 isoform X1 [Aphidius gifuensis]KAF7990576.1 hypothetical protein HCN44_000381 [Aphidius gifuensis]
MEDANIERATIDENTSLPIIYPQGINEIQINAINADTIGDTLYSKKWIIETLLSLSKISDKDEWSETLENKFCMLWDMTLEKDVVFFLVENHFLPIAEVVINQSHEPRLTEIIVGIVANMCCQSEVLKHFEKMDEFVNSLMNLLASDDTEILIQVLRILQAAIWNITSEKPAKKWLCFINQCEIFGQALTFILQSSTNGGLLISTLNLLQSAASVQLSTKCLLESSFDIKLLLSAMIEAFNQLIPRKKSEKFYTNTDMIVVEVWLEIFTKIIQMDTNLKCNIDDDNCEALIELLIRILDPCKKYDELRHFISLNESLIFHCIYQAVESIYWFQQRGFSVDIEAISTILQILHQLSLLNDEYINHAKETEKMRELQIYLENYWIKILERYTPEDIHKLLDICSKDTQTFVISFPKSKLTSIEILKKLS